MNRRTDVSFIGLLPVDFGWEIITMVNEDPGSQLLLIPDHSHSPLFWHIIPWKNMKSQCSAVGWFLFMDHNPLSLSPTLSLPAPFLPPLLTAVEKEEAEQPSRPRILTPTTGALLPSAFWNDFLDTIYSKGFLCVTVENHFLSDVHDVQLQALTGVRQLHRGFLFFIHCISDSKLLSIHIICPSPHLWHQKAGEETLARLVGTSVQLLTELFFSSGPSL